jgi:hypothetical protein
MGIEILRGTKTDKAKKFSSCWTCSQKIQFDPTRKSKGGKLIPLNEDGSPHDCPMNYFKPNRNNSNYSNDNQKPPVVKAMTVINATKGFQQDTLAKFTDVYKRFVEVQEQFKFQQSQMTALQQEVKLLRQQLATNNDNDNSSRRADSSE